MENIFAIGKSEGLKQSKPQILSNQVLTGNAKLEGNEIRMFFKS